MKNKRDKRLNYDNISKLMVMPSKQCKHRKAIIRFPGNIFALEVNFLSW